MLTNDDGTPMETKDFFQTHATRFLEMALRTDRQETVRQPDGYGKKTGNCRDTVEIFLTVREDRIAAVSYQLDGCMHTNACVNAVAELVTGRSVEGAWEIAPEDVAAYLESLPADHFHCAELAVGALYLALADYRQLKQKPWQKNYRR